MYKVISRLKSIESNNHMLQLANDFQSLYLRKAVNRDKAQWAIVGYQLELLINYIFKDDMRILRFRDILKLIEKLEFNGIRGPERGHLLKEIRNVLESDFGAMADLSADITKKRMDRIIWELVSVVSLETVERSLLPVFPNKR